MSTSFINLKCLCRKRKNRTFLFNILSAENRNCCSGQGHPVQGQSCTHARHVMQV